MAVIRFRPSVLIDSRRRRNLTQLQLATLAEDACVSEQQEQPGHSHDEERDRRIRAWESRIGAWERGIDAPSATYIPTLTKILEVEPLALLEVDPGAPPFTALRLVAGLTLQALAEATGISYTSLHRMARGVSRLSEEAAERVAGALGVTVTELVASIEMDR